MELRNAANQVVTGTTAYDAATVTATFTPQTDLAYSTTYTVNVSGARDPSGNTMAPISWSFQTSAPPPPGIDDGPGGPIAVVTSSGNPSSSYLTEILRAEGLNEFANLRVSSLTAATLAPYSMVVLGDVPLSDPQVAALTAWVNAGGNLVAMRPDARLYSLAGISAQSGTVADGYVALNPASEPAPASPRRPCSSTAPRTATPWPARPRWRGSTPPPPRTPACRPSPCAAWAPAAARSPPSPSTSPAR